MCFGKLFKSIRLFMKNDHAFKMECKFGGFFSFFKGFGYNTLIKIIGAGDVPYEIANGESNKIKPVFVVLISILIVFVGDIAI